MALDVLLEFLLELKISSINHCHIPLESSLHFQILYFSEWTEFTEAMNEEVVKSNQLLEEEDEYSNLARDIGKSFAFSV